MNSPADVNDSCKEFARLSGLGVRQSVQGAAFTTYSVGGPFEFLVEVQNQSELVHGLRAFAQLGLDYRVLGYGSNILLSDEGVSGWTVKLGTGLRTYISQGGARFRVGGSMSLMTLSRKISELGYSGLEFAGGIPASLGGAICMNAGAHGGEMAEVVRTVTLVLPGGEEIRLAADELDFSYRHSNLPAGAIIVEAELQLVESSREQTTRTRAEFLQARKATQPLTLPSSGSVFRNPAGDLTAGELLEKAGLKGRRVGNAQISELHANWIVNLERSARARDVKSLIDLCQQEVRKRFEVQLHREVIYW